MTEFGIWMTFIAFFILFAGGASLYGQHMESEQVKACVEAGMEWVTTENFQHECRAK